MLASYISGIVATLTPCTIVIIPVFIYRFGLYAEKNSKKLIKELFLTLFGFILGLFVTALLFNQLLNSPLNNLLRLILGTAFIILGVLQLANKFSLNLIKNYSNSLVLGFVLPWAISFSPCVLPFFATIVAGGIDSGEIFIRISMFGLGLLSPAILVSIMGNRMMQMMKKTTPFMGKIEKYSGVLLIGTGIYLNFEILNIRTLDITIATIFFSILILFAAYTIFIKNKLINIPNILMFISFGILSYIFFNHCYGKTTHNPDTLKPIPGVTSSYQMSQCGAKTGECEVCNRCATLFTVAAFIGSAGYLLASSKYFTSRNFKKHLK